MLKHFKMIFTTTVVGKILIMSPLWGSGEIFSTHIHRGTTTVIADKVIPSGSHQSLELNADTIITTADHTVEGDLTVLGATTLANLAAGSSTLNSVTIANNASVSGTLEVAGSTSFNGGITINNGITVPSNQHLTLNGTIVGTNPVTIDNGIDLRVTGSTHLLGKLDMNSNKFTVGPTGNTTINGTLSAIGVTTLGSSRIFGEKATIASIGTFATNILTINFTTLAGSTAPLKFGANIKIQCFLAGTTLALTNSVNYYEGNLCISPGSTSGASCTRASLGESTTTLVGVGSTLTSGVSGTGTTATITLSSLLPLTSQSVMIFYEVVSNNISSIS